MLLIPSPAWCPLIASLGSTSGALAGAFMESIGSTRGFWLIFLKSERSHATMLEILCEYNPQMFYIKIRSLRPFKHAHCTLHIAMHMHSVTSLLSFNYIMGKEVKYRTLKGLSRWWGGLQKFITETVDACVSQSAGSRLCFFRKLASFQL